jgi:hypothetical protein
MAEHKKHVDRRKAEVDGKPVERVKSLIPTETSNDEAPEEEGWDDDWDCGDDCNICLKQRARLCDPFWDRMDGLLDKALWSKMEPDHGRILEYAKFFGGWSFLARMSEAPYGCKHGGKTGLSLLYKLLRRWVAKSLRESDLEPMKNPGVTFLVGLVVGAGVRFGLDLQPRILREKATIEKRKSTRKCRARRRATTAYTRFLELKLTHDYSEGKFHPTDAYHTISKEMGAHFKTVAEWIRNMESEMGRHRPRETNLPATESTGKCLHKQRQRDGSRGERESD